MKQPTKDEILKKLEMILFQVSTREEIADWAMGHIKDDNLEITDFYAWELLKTVGGVDIAEGPGQYLYSNYDIRKWIKDALSLS